MISLQKIRQQLPWIDILTKNTGGGGIYHFLTPQFLQTLYRIASRSKRNALWKHSVRVMHTSCLSAYAVLQVGRRLPRPA
jgi:hypothetical protein